MAYYTPGTLTRDQKKRLARLISEASRLEIELHDWITGETDTYDLYYTKPSDRTKVEDNGHSITSNEDIEQVNIYKLMEVVKDRVPVNGVAFIKKLNMYADQLDKIYIEKGK